MKPSKIITPNTNLSQTKISVKFRMTVIQMFHIRR